VKDKELAARDYIAKYEDIKGINEKNLYADVYRFNQAIINLIEAYKPVLEKLVKTQS
jgi:uncharacterized lipoprotein YehR (DUF1307 family)